MATVVKEVVRQPLSPAKQPQPSVDTLTPRPVAQPADVVLPTHEGFVEHDAVASYRSRMTESRRLANAHRWDGGIDWPVAAWLAVIHLGALAAPFTFTWVGLATFVVLYWLTGSVGICLGYHRLLSHASFTVTRPVRLLIAFLGGLAGEGSALQWTAVHRKHHALSDQEGDPHSPLDGPWWSHMLWFLPRMSDETRHELHSRWAPDLLKDPVIRFLDRTFLLWHLVLGGCLFALGYALWDTRTAWSLVTWGMFARLVYVLHVTWMINSATHIWGYRNYETTDESRNLWWVALLSFGEGWHNNHHAHPRLAKHGHHWWELDGTYGVIWLMEKLGLAKQVVRTRSRRFVQR